MNRRVRRAAVVLGVAASLVLGVVSIQVAADLTAAAAPPPAPPISMASLKDQLAAEQARASALQDQLAGLLEVTGQLTAAVDSTEAQVSDDGLTAAQLRERLKAAEAKLKAVNQLLKKAQARLAVLGESIANAPAAAKPPSGGGGLGSGPTSAPTIKPATGTFSLFLSLTDGGVRATWTVCSTSGFHAYALVRSTDSEIHYPPEDHDTLVAQIGSTAASSALDAAAPSGSLWYRVYCLIRPDGETKVAKTTSTVRITAP